MALNLNKVVFKNHSFLKMSDGTLKLFAYYLLLHEKNPRQLVFLLRNLKMVYTINILHLFAGEMRQNVLKISQ